PHSLLQCCRGVHRLHDRVGGRIVSVNRVFFRSGTSVGSNPPCFHCCSLESIQRLAGSPRETKNATRAGEEARGEAESHSAFDSSTGAITAFLCSSYGSDRY